MLAKPLSTLAALLLLACSGGTTNPDAQSGGSGGSAGVGGVGGQSAAGGPVGDDRLFVPESVQVMAKPGLNSAFNVTSLTLYKGADTSELYAAVRNDDDSPACNPSFSVELLDKAGQTLAAGVSGLLMQHFYRLTDGSGSIAGCVAPGELTMVVIRKLSLDTALEDVGEIVYFSNYWHLDVAPLGSVDITDVQAVSRSTGVAFTGALVNGLDVALDNPSVDIFPVNRVGRPLGAAFSSGLEAVAPGSSWTFETDTVSETGVDTVAFLAGGS